MKISKTKLMELIDDAIFQNLSESKDEEKIKLAKKLRAMNIDDPPKNIFLRKESNMDSLNLEEFIREYITNIFTDKQNISERIKLKKLLPEEIIDWQGRYDDDFKFKKDMLVKDINPDCPHRNSEGKVTKVSDNEVTYVTTNNGRNWSIGDELTKTKDQLTPLAEFPFAKDFEEVGDKK